MTVPNRLAQAATVSLFSDHAVDSKRNFDYYVERARGGIGLIVTGNRLVHPSSTTGKPRYSWAYLRRAIRGDRRITDAVHEHGTKIVAQLAHFGVNGASDAADDLRVLWGPSAVKSPAYGETAKELEPEEIRELSSWWARSAAVSREAGFDGVELHMGHSYLLHQFLSPLYNKRTDEYGGSLENRMRFPREVVEDVRGAVGPDFVLGVRVSLSDFIDGALDLDDAIAIARLLAGTGHVDYLALTAAGLHNIYLEIPPSDVPAGGLLEMTATVKAEVADLPIMAVGGLTDPEAAEEIVASGNADIVTMSRAINADPEFANKARDGRADEIIHCIRCNQGCIGAFWRGFPIACTLNPVSGHEGRFGHGTLTPADPAVHWLVAGGGPAGMKAAETLARRGSPCDPAREGRPARRAGQPDSEDTGP